jgi:hypothetical protein
MKEADFYRDNGYVHARGVFDAAEVDEMGTAIDRILADVEGTANDANHRWTAAQKETVLPPETGAPFPMHQPDR